jgi:hypothetical protein
MRQRLHGYHTTKRSVHLSVLDRRVWAPAIAAREETCMSFGEVVMVLLFLMVFVAVPMFFAQIGRRRSPGLANLQVCPECGAHNYQTKERCYCCGCRFVSPRSDGSGPVAIPVAHPDDGGRTEKPTAPVGLREVAVTLLHKNKAGRS